MEHLPFTPHGTRIHIEGFPDAIKVIELKGSKARRLADLALHKNDLQNALDHLLVITQLPDQLDLSHTIRESLLVSSIIQFTKCFGNSNARESLNSSLVYKDEPAIALEVFKYFKSLRDKHVAHDDNSYAQCFPGAVLNAEGSSCKIGKIICLDMRAVTLENTNLENLKLLILKAQEWVSNQFDTLCQEITNDLESEPYASLLARNDVKAQAPLVEEIHKNRGKG